ncbi:MAG: hypothetical protein F6K41_35790 [Symploca sp. SIO3E6]|nr:hypothetical protein [Caldora sp. SIO3E6]
MGAEKLNSFARSFYDYGFRRDAHQLLAWGYQDTLPEIHCNLTEEEITGLIVEAIEKRLDDPSTPEKFDRYSIDEEKPIAVEGRKGKKRRRLDLVVVSSHSRPRPKYIFEAKRLRKNGYPIGKYVGEDGLQCFVQGVYASQYPEAAMIGYVQSDIASYWESELKRSFDLDLNNDLRITQLLQKAQVLSSIPDVWVSQHEREVGNLITVYHIFLNCSVSFV